MIFNPCKKCLIRSTCDTECDKLEKHSKLFQRTFLILFCTLCLIFDSIVIYLLYLVAGSYTKWILLGIILVIILSTLSEVVKSGEDDFLVILFMMIIIIGLPLLLVCGLTNLLDDFDEIPHRYINANKKRK